MYFARFNYAAFSIALVTLVGGICGGLVRTTDLRVVIFGLALVVGWWLSFCRVQDLIKPPEKFQ